MIYDHDDFLPRLIWYHWYVTYFALLMHSISIHNDNITSYRYIVFKTTDFSPKTFMRQYHLFSRISPNLPRHRTKKGKKWKEKCIVIHPHRTSWDVKKIIEGKKEMRVCGRKRQRRELKRNTMDRAQSIPSEFTRWHRKSVCTYLQGKARKHWILLNPHLSPIKPAQLLTSVFVVRLGMDETYFL